MRFVCDAADGQSWFQIETEAEAAEESRLMGHAVEKHYRRAQDAAAHSFSPAGIPFIEQEIRRASHVRRAMPRFLTLRDSEGTPLVTAMLPPLQPSDLAFRPIVVGQDNSDPYPAHGDSIGILARHAKTTLDRAACYPYRRG